MKIYNKIRDFCESKAEYWYIFAAIFAALWIMDFAFLGLVIPIWICKVISLVFVTVVMFYVKIMYSYFKNEHIKRIAERQEEILSRMENMQNHIEELYSESIEHSEQTANKLREDILEKISVDRAYVISSLTHKADEIQADINKDFEEQKKLSDGLSESIKTLNEDVIKKSNKLEETANSNLKKTEELIKVKTEKDDAAILSVKEQLDNSYKNAEVLSGQLQETLETVRNTLNNTKHLSDKLDDEMAALNIKLNEKNVRDQESFESAAQTVSQMEINLISSIEQNSERSGRFFNEQNNKLDSISETIMQEIAARSDEQKAYIADSQNDIIEEAKQCSHDTNERIATAEENIDAKINEISDSIAASLKTEASQLCNTLTDNDNRIINQSEVYMESMRDSLNKIASDVSLGNEKSDKFAEKLDSETDKLNQLLLDKIDKIAADIDKMQNVVSTMLVQILDIADDNADKTDKFYSRIFNQILNFSKNTENRFNDIREEIDSYNQQINSDNKAIYSETLEQKQKLSDLSDNFDLYCRVSENYRKEAFERLNNLKNQVDNLNALSQMLKNISAMQQLAESDLSTKKTTKDNQQRVEKFRDNETGIILKNHYKKNKLVSAQMFDGERKTYEVEYDENSKIKISRNYGKNGEVITELHFYPTGQVKKRIEKVVTDGKKKTVTHEYDENGKAKK